MKGLPFIQVERAGRREQKRWCNEGGRLALIFTAAFFSARSSFHRSSMAATRLLSRARNASPPHTAFPFLPWLPSPSTSSSPQQPAPSPPRRWTTPFERQRKGNSAVNIPFWSLFIALPRCRRPAGLHPEEESKEAGDDPGIHRRRMSNLAATMAKRGLRHLLRHAAMVARLAHSAVYPPRGGAPPIRQR